MAYTKQTFSFNQVVTATQMNQIETNIADHVHGKDGVGKTGVSWPLETLTAGQTLTEDDVGKLFECNSTPYTLDFDGVSSLSDGWGVTIANRGNDTLTLSPNGSELINSLSTLDLEAGDVVFVYANDVGLRTLDPISFDSATMSANGTGLQNTSYAIRDTATIFVPSDANQIGVIMSGYFTRSSGVNQENVFMKTAIESSSTIIEWSETNINGADYYRTRLGWITVGSTGNINLTVETRSGAAGSFFYAFESQVMAFVLGPT